MSFGPESINQNTSMKFPTVRDPATVINNLESTVHFGAFLLFWHFFSKIGRICCTSLLRTTWPDGCRKRFLKLSFRWSSWRPRANQILKTNSLTHEQHPKAVWTSEGKALGGTQSPPLPSVAPHTTVAHSRRAMYLALCVRIIYVLTATSPPFPMRTRKKT